MLHWDVSGARFPPPSMQMGFNSWYYQYTYACFAADAPVPTQRQSDEAGGGAGGREAGEEWQTRLLGRDGRKPEVAGGQQGEAVGEPDDCTFRLQSRIAQRLFPRASALTAALLVGGEPSQVLVEGRDGRVRVGDVRVGERVEAAGAGGSRAFSRVYFVHDHPGRSPVLRLAHDDGGCGCLGFSRGGLALRGSARVPELQGLCISARTAHVPSAVAASPFEGGAGRAGERARASWNGCGRAAGCGACRRRTPCCAGSEPRQGGGQADRMHCLAQPTYFAVGL